MACDRSRVSQSGRGDAMSVLDQVRALEQQVLGRLRELRPLVTEYRDLAKVAERLGLKRDDDEASETATPAASEPARQSKTAAKRRAKPAAGAGRSKHRAPAKPKPTATDAPTAVAKPKPRSVASKPKAGAKPTATAVTMAEPKPAATAKPV